MNSPISRSLLRDYTDGGFGIGSNLAALGGGVAVGEFEPGRASIFRVASGCYSEMSAGSCNRNPMSSTLACQWIFDSSDPLIPVRAERGH